MSNRVDLAPCATCGRPAMIGDGPGNTWQIGCFRAGCNSKPVRYRDGNARSKSAAVRVWNTRWERKQTKAGNV